MRGRRLKMPKDQGEGETMDQVEKRIKKEAGIDPKRGESYTSPGGFIKIPTPSGGPVHHTPSKKK
jgi:hypothetical protein